MSSATVTVFVGVIAGCVLLQTLAIVVLTVVLARTLVRLRKGVAPVIDNAKAASGNVARATDEVREAARRFGVASSYLAPIAGFLAAFLSARRKR